MPYWFDGNNLIGQSAAVSRKDRNTRKAFLETLSAYQKSGGGRFLVYFDGDDPADLSTPTGITVRYSAPESADIVILRRLKEIQRTSEVIVITNDLELASRCRHAGASSLKRIYRLRVAGRKSQVTGLRLQVPGFRFRNLTCNLELGT
jgi:predicted RNA-binding protein with PIN domain